MIYITSNGYSFDERITIREAYSRYKGNYKYIFPMKMSILEYYTWIELRSIPEGMDFKPEFPIGKYFVDFGDPNKKIAIECDSIKFHKGKELQDRLREKEIIGMGWKIFRFNSRQILSNIIEKIENTYYLFDTGDKYQNEINRHSHECVGCFLRSSFFKSLYDDEFDDLPEFYFDSY